MTLELQGRPATSIATGRLTPRSSIAGADAERARRTHAELAEPAVLEEAGERVLARLRRFMAREGQELHSRS